DPRGGPGDRSRTAHLGAAGARCHEHRRAAGGSRAAAGGAASADPRLLGVGRAARAVEAEGLALPRGPLLPGALLPGALRGARFANRRPARLLRRRFAPGWFLPRRLALD